jgi:hypothetical protein
MTFWKLTRDENDELVLIERQTQEPEPTPVCSCPMDAEYDEHFGHGYEQ